MVRYVKPVQRSENLIDLSTKPGAAGRATNRVANAERARRIAEQLKAEAISQAMKLRRQRPR